MDYKTKELEKKHELKIEIETLEEDVKKYTYFKQIYEEEEIIIEYFMGLEEGI